MKRIITVILAVMCALALCACSDNGDGTKAQTKTEYKPDYGELYYASDDVKFGILDAADEVLVNDVDGTERVTGITLADDTVSNPQGVKIGMKGDEALKLMDGLEYTQSGDTYKFTVGSTLFRLQVGADGTVKAAEYSVAANDN